MSKEEIQQLIEELESLRKENLDLKTSAGLPSPEIINGYPAPAKIKEDVILKGLRTQIESLRESNQYLRKALEQSEDIERSLATLLPALEVQLKGQTTEIYHLKLNIDQTENTFAGVVRKLEQQLKDLAKSHEEEKKQMEQQFQQEILRIQADLLTEQSDYKVSSEITEVSENDNPFTDLSIFEI